MKIIRVNDCEGNNHAIFIDKIVSLCERRDGIAIIADSGYVCTVPGITLNRIISLIIQVDGQR